MKPDPNCHDCGGSGLSSLKSMPSVEATCKCLLRKSRRETILDTVSDLVSGFLYYDRKEDDDLPRGAVEEAIANGEITGEEIVAAFAKECGFGGELT